MVEFSVLGALEVVRDGEHLAVASRRQRALITRLLLGRGQVVSVDALVDALWDGEPPERAQHALHTYVSRVRALLGQAVVTRPPGYLLSVPAQAVDANRFEAAVARAPGLLADDPEAAARLLGEALALWRGPAHSEFADTFARPAAVRLEELRLSARELRGEALLVLGSLDRAIGELGGLVADEPLRERPHGQLMRALFLAGRQTDALDLYRRHRDRVREELGLEPSPELQRVHEAVLRQAVEAPARRRPRATAAQRRPAPPAASPGPAPATSFVGRDAELAALAGLVGQSRIVTLVGPGGVGKTRLAQELVARRGGGDGGGAVWWVDLAPARSPGDVPYRFVDTLAVPEPAEGAIEDFVVTVLRTGRGLLIADSCEHVIEPVARILERIAESCPDVSVIATSRERLAVAGEHVLTVQPLPDPGVILPGHELRSSPAVALFADRLRAAGAGDLTDDEVSMVAEVCRRIGRLPLAIELAAARARSLGVAAVAERPSLDLLAGARRTGQARHRSLRAVVDWSYDLLSSRERILFRRLAAFSGSFSLDDVENVCADASLDRAVVAEALAGLVDKSMVAGPERDRYRLLDPMRAYAVERLAEHGEDEWVRAAHARHHVDLAEQAGRGLATPAEADWADRITREIDELRSALRWACAHDADLAVRLSAALSVYAEYRMRFEMHDWAAAAAALPEAEGHPLRAVALSSAATGAWLRGDFEQARELAERGRAAAPGDDPLAAKAVLVLGDIALLESRFADAVREYEEAVRLVGDTEPYVACEALGGSAIARSYQGDIAGAARLADASRRLADGVGAPGLRAISLYWAGESLLVNDPDAALVLLEESRRLAAEMGVLFVVGLATLSSVSIRARASTDPGQALAAYREAIEHWHRVGNRTQQWVTLRNLVPTLVRAGQDELACVIHAALATAPVRLPADGAVPEAEALAEAFTLAGRRLGDAAAAAAAERGARMSLDELVAAALAVIDGAAAGRALPAPAQTAGSSR